MSCVTIHLLERWTHFLTSWLDSAELHEWSCIWWLIKIKSVSGSEDDDNSLIPTVYQNLCAFMSYTGFVAFEENAQCFILLFKCSFFVFFSFSNYNESQRNAPHFQKKKNLKTLKKDQQYSQNSPLIKSTVVRSVSGVRQLQWVVSKWICGHILKDELG